jgi:beta-galactosidase
MKLRFGIILLGLLICASFAAAEPRITLPFDAGWHFFKGAAPGAEAIGFDDTKWRLVDVPHDWSIEGPFAEENATGPGGGYLPAGVGWYRRHFALPDEYAGSRVFIEFDGVMANSDVWINGVHWGSAPLAM